MDVHIVTGDMHARAHSPVASPRLNGRLVEWEGEGVNYAMIRIICEYVALWMATNCTLSFCSFLYFVCFVMIQVKNVYECICPLSCKEISINDQAAQFEKG